MVDDAVKRVFALSRQDIYFIVIILMLGVQMAFNFSLIEPLRDIQERIEHDQRVEIAKVVEEIRDTHNSSGQTVYRLNKMMNKDNLSVFLLAFAAGLFISSMTQAYTQTGVNVTTPSGETEEVPTLTDAIQTNLQSIIALITSIIAIIGLIIKSGILDPWITKKKQDQFYTIPNRVLSQ